MPTNLSFPAKPQLTQCPHVVGLSMTSRASGKHMQAWPGTCSHPSHLLKCRWFISTAWDTTCAGRKSCSWGPGLPNSTCPTDSLGRLNSQLCVPFSAGPERLQPSHVLHKQILGQGALGSLEPLYQPGSACAGRTHLTLASPHRHTEGQ